MGQVGEHGARRRDCLGQVFLSATKPRVDPVETPDEPLRELLAKTLLAPDGSFLNVFTTLAHRPRLLRRFNSMGAYFTAHDELVPRDRELVILRTAAHARSRYEIGQHRRLGAQAGLTAEEIHAALDPAAEHAWSESDSALLALSDELTATDTVSDALWERLGERYDDEQRIDLLALVGYYRMLAGVLNGLRVQLEGQP